VGRMGATEIRRLFARVASSRLSYGKPVRNGDRTVIPVSRTYVAGGFGFRPGQADAGDPGEGGGGGGVVVSRPMGFIESGPEGARFQPIVVHSRARVVVGAVATGALAGTVVAGTAVGAVAARRAVRALPRLRRPRAARLPSPRRLLRR